jgi:predicted GNAT family N-acyltransferase
MWNSYHIQILNWQENESALRFVRKAVFILEQQIPEDLEWDEFDSISMHILALNSDAEPIGTARLLPDGHIGRMAILKEWRGKRVGSAIMERILQEMIRRDMRKAKLNAQVTARNFYGKFGFQASGKEFMEAGIPHIKMTLELF